MSTTAHPPLTVPTFTVEDLERLLADLPDEGGRYELLEGMLLVTPAPKAVHQVVLSRLFERLAGAVQGSGHAHVVSPGEIERGRNTKLQPDLLVYPSTFPPHTDWTAISGWWLAVEVLSPSSRVYDREVKRRAYLELGVAEVWLVDINARELAVWRRGDAQPTRWRDGDVMRWHPAPLPHPVIVDLAALFAGTAPVLSSEEA
jgi:Uma2 family endonuclease